MSTITGFHAVLGNNFRDEDGLRNPGIWTELIASTSEDYAGFYVLGQPESDCHVFMLAVGAAGSEVTFAVVPPEGMFVPVPIAAGSRISGASQWNTTNNSEMTILPVPSANVAADPSVTKFHTGPWLFGSSGAYDDGFFTTAATTNDVKTAWEEVSLAGANVSYNVLNGDSVGEDYSYFGVALSGIYVGVSGGIFYTVDVAIGASGAEIAVLENIVFEGTINGDYTPFQFRSELFPIAVSTGDRISIRYSVPDVTKDAGLGVLLMAAG